MLTVEEARFIVVSDIHKDSDDLTKYVICREEEFEKGWCFNVQSRAYMETGDQYTMVIGAGPYVVDKYTGQLHTYSSICSCMDAKRIYSETEKSGLDIEHAMWEKMKQENNADIRGVLPDNTR